ncbi:MAG: ComEC/Rec2 family competence protein [Clostridia bacterium]|nr:ComEC/Rec2 family competence protein [Clostridia bacterium]
MKFSVNFRLAVFLTAGLILGILFSYCAFFGFILGATIAVVLSAAFCIVFLFFSTAKFNARLKILWFSSFLICALVGGFGLHFTLNNYENADLDGQILTICGKIDDISEKDGYSVLVIGDVEISGKVNGKSPYSMTVYLYGDDDFIIGDVVTFKTAIKDRTTFYNGKFSAAAISGKVKYYATVGREEITRTASSPDIFQRCNLFIKNVLKSGLDEEEFSVAYAMLTGDSEYIAEEDLAAFRAAGVAHIFAVSGLHIGFLAAAVYFVLKKIRVKNAVAFSLTFLLCLFYAGVCGFSASSVRAVIMFFFLNFGKITGLKYDSLSALFAAAFAILVVNPVQLFCAGFLLSFSVVFTVIVLNNPLVRLLKFLPEKLAAAFAISFAAEVGGAPVLLYFFGSFPLVALFVNLLFIPISGVVFIALVLGTLLGGFLPPAVCLFVQNYALYGLGFVITSFNFELFLVGGFTLGWFALSYYATLVLAGGLINIKRLTKTVVCCLLVVVTVVGVVGASMLNGRKTYAYIMGSDNLSAVLFTYDDRSTLVISDISYGNFSGNKLIGLLKNANGDRLTVVLLKQDKNVDLVPMITKIRYTAKSVGITADALYYFGERDAGSEYLTEQLFDGFITVNTGEGDKFDLGSGGFEFIIDGRGLIFTRNGYNTGVFSSLLYGDLSAYGDRKFNAVICPDSRDERVIALNPEQTAGFNDGGYSGVNEGYFSLTLG